MQSEKKEKQNRRPALARLHDALDVPLEGIANVSRIEIVGGCEAIVDGCECVLIYTAECVLVRVREGYVRITGKNLAMQSLQHDRITICGEVRAVFLCDTAEARSV